MTAAATPNTPSPPSARHITTRRAALQGANAMAPWLIGVVPFGMVVGVTAASSSLPGVLALISGLTIYSGSAQLAATRLVDSEAAVAVVVTTVLVLNARLALYGASMASHWRGSTLWHRVLCSYLLVDPSFAVGEEGYRRSGSRRLAHAHYLGGATILWVAWQASLGLGMAVGTSLPAALHLELAVPLFLIAEATATFDRPSARRAAAVAAIVAIPAIALPLGSGLIAATVAGIAAAGITRRTRR